MKKLIITSLFLLLSLNCFAKTRTIYFTRHGQRGSSQYQVKFQNCDEDALMPDGQKQAALLGEYLNSIGFNGTIYVSPYYRTLQTATIAASKLPNMPMILEPRLQENAKVKNASGKVYTIKNCLTKKEIKKNFPNVIIPSSVKFPWRIENERQSQMDERISAFIDEKLTTTSGDLFCVAHGTLLKGVIREMQKRGADFPKQNVYNCCLYAFTFDTETNQIVDSKDLTMNYLYNGIVTDNLAYIPVE